MGQQRTTRDEPRRDETIRGQIRKKLRHKTPRVQMGETTCDEDQVRQKDTTQDGTIRGEEKTRPDGTNRNKTRQSGTAQYRIGQTKRQYKTGDHEIYTLGMN